MRTASGEWSPAAAAFQAEVQAGMVRAFREYQAQGYDPDDVYLLVRHAVTDAWAELGGTYAKNNDGFRIKSGMTRGETSGRSKN